MSKKITGTLKLVIPAGKANPSPPVGPALGQRGVNIMEFCKQFNERTKQFKENTPIPVNVTVFNDKSFTFISKTPSVSFFIKQACSLSKGSSNPGKEASVATLTSKQLYEIAAIKKMDPAFGHLSMEKVVKMFVGTAKSMGVSIE